MKILKFPFAIISLLSLSLSVYIYNLSHPTFLFGHLIIGRPETLISNGLFLFFIGLTSLISTIENIGKKNKLLKENKKLINDIEAINSLFNVAFNENKLLLTENNKLKETIIENNSLMYTSVEKWKLLSEDKDKYIAQLCNEITSLKQKPIPDKSNTKKTIKTKKKKKRTL